MDQNGNLFGTTVLGGNSNSNCEGQTCGTVFKLSPPTGGNGTWSENILYAFQGTSDGFFPSGGLLESNGNLYGTTMNGGNLQVSCNASPGCGTVFELSPSTSGVWTETVLYAFAGGTDGGSPQATLYMDANGNLFGTTVGGPGTGCTGVGCPGTVFEVSPPSQPGGAWTEQVIHSFGGEGDGIWPLDNLIANSDGELFGTAGQGGIDSCNDNSGLVGCGIVFKLSPTKTGVWTETVLHSFQGPPDGAFPSSGLILGTDGLLYGTTNLGGTGQCTLAPPPATTPIAGCGTIFSLPQN